MPAERPELLITKALLPGIMAELEAIYAVHRLWEAPDRAACLAAVGPRVRALVTTGGVGASAELLQALPKLEMIAVHGVGTDAVAMEAAAARGLAVTTTADALTDDVADMAVALLLAVSRDLVAADAYVRAGAWERGEARPLSRRVSGKRAGIVGLGRIGHAVAQRLGAFGVRVAYHNRRPVAGSAFRYYADVGTLAQDSDLLIISAAGGPASAGVISRAVLQALGPQGILINVARGSLVDQAAMIELLATKQLGAAGLDVFAGEPSVPEALRRLPNVVLQPHQASATVETRQAMGEAVLRSLASHFAAGRVVS